ncbi:nucleotidyltransferase domain-containing protein [Candidatus Woesearchaeota archaeon]|nr:nucleotidyltransferase domain-containing protein [Candidatus Woesearchaeota archaeon]
MKDLIKFADDISVEYPLNKMILFGSQATGKVHRDSDVDLILVSKTFQKKRRLARSPPLYLRWTLDYPVDFLCYTPEEFERKKKQIGIVKQAVKEGIQIV